MVNTRKRPAPKSEKSASTRIKKKTVVSKRRTTKKSPSPASKSRSPANISPRSGAKYIIYHEGGDVYRPFIIIENLGHIWITPNIAFYQTSGQSNDKFGGIYANTWLPTAGMLAENTEINGKPEEKGYITKMSTLYGEPKIHVALCNIIKRYIKEKYGDSEITRDIVSDQHNLNRKIYIDDKGRTKMDVIENYHTILREYKEIHEFVGSYFAFDWQLYISAKLGTGYWDKNEQFRNYMLREENAVDIAIPNVNIVNNKPVDNEDEVISFLQANQALASKNDIANFAKDIPESNCDKHIISKYRVINELINQQARKEAAIARIQHAQKKTT